MRINPFSAILTFAALLGGTLSSAAPTFGAEWEESSPYYEDDAWYDVSEWLDGNDYNPTDEQFGVWDDEAYDSDSAEFDYDDDYGYDDVTSDDDWYYDYWDRDYVYYPSTTAGTYDYKFAYRDYDDDGLYDAYTTYYDWDDDGYFEDIDTYALNQTGDQGSKQNANDRTEKKKDAGEQRISARREELAGIIRAKKLVDVRGVDHVVLNLSGENQTTAVDLGPEKNLKSADLALGKQVTASGSLTKAGDKQVLLAQSVTIDGETLQIDRRPRRFQGTVVDTREIKVRNQRHKLVVLKTSNGKQRVIDLGPTDRLPNVNLDKNATLSVRGVPFKRNDRPVVMALSVESGNESAMIDRGTRR